MFQLDVDDIRHIHRGALTGPCGERELHRIAEPAIGYLLEGYVDPEDIEEQAKRIAELEKEAEASDQKYEALEAERDALLDRVAELETALEGWTEVAALVKARALLESVGA